MKTPQNQNPAQNLNAAPSRIVSQRQLEGALIKTARGHFQSFPYTMDGANALPLQADAKRNYLMIQNTSAAQSIRIAFGTQAGPNTGFTLGPTAQWEFTSAVPINEISIFGPSGVIVEIVLGTDAGERF